MERKIVIPEEFPDIKSKPKKIEKKNDNEFELIKFLTEEPENGKNEKSELNYMPKFKEKQSAVVILSLSGEKNFKAVTNWMRKHMEAYPETHDGFFVKFIDTDNDNKGYKVEVCSEDEKGEKINGVNYKILPYIFDVTDDIMKDTGKKIIETIKVGKNTEIDKINRYFDRRNEEKEISKKIVETLKSGDNMENK